MKYLFTLLVLYSVTAQGEWILQKNLKTIDTSDHRQMIRSFSTAKGAMDMLSRISVTSPHRVIAHRAQVWVGLYSWNPEPHCQLADPKNDTNVRITTYRYHFHYQNDPYANGRLEGTSNPPKVLCSRGEAHTPLGNKVSLPPTL